MKFEHDGPGRPYYETYRAGFNKRARRGGNSTLPPWNKLKPWHAKVWNEVATAGDSRKYGLHLSDVTA